MLSRPEAEFDRFAASYAAQHERSITLSGESADYFARYKINDVARICDLQQLKPARILDFGAGTGNSLVPMQRMFADAHISCIDVSADSLELCREVATGRTDIRCYDGETIPFEDGTFDLVFTACVFHHIPAELHVSLLAEIRRVLKPDGRFLLYEHNPWNPLTVHAVRTCPFDENAVLISAPEMTRRLQAAGFGHVARWYRVFFPRFLSRLRRIEWSLAPLPVGAQYLLVGAR